MPFTRQHPNVEELVSGRRRVTQWLWWSTLWVVLAFSGRHYRVRTYFVSQHELEREREREGNGALRSERFLGLSSMAQYLHTYVRTTCCTFFFFFRICFDRIPVRTFTYVRSLFIDFHVILLLRTYVLSSTSRPQVRMLWKHKQSFVQTIFQIDINSNALTL